MSSGFPPSPANNPFGDFNNPYQSPAGNFGPAPNAPYGFQTPRDQALQRVKWPAIFLICLAPLGMILAVVDLGFRIANWGDLSMLGPNPRPGAEQGFYAGQIGSMVIDVAALVLQIVVIYGSVQMMQLRSLTWARAANIISVIPCLSACCLLGIPFGIWGLVLLNDPGIKQHFES